MAPLPSSSLSTAALQSKLRELRNTSDQHGKILTQRLASSQAGQNLLHIGTALSSLPPDLHLLLTQLHPVLSSAESTERQHLAALQNLVNEAHQVRIQRRKMVNARACASQYQELVTAEVIIRRDVELRKDLAMIEPLSSSPSTAASVNPMDATSKSDFNGTLADHIMSLERCAHSALMLLQSLQCHSEMLAEITSAKAAGLSTASGKDNSILPSTRTPLEPDTDRAQFLMRLSPRIRRLESDTMAALTARFEYILQQMQSGSSALSNDQLLLITGHCLRGLSLLGRGKDVEGIFARVAIMPLIRSKVSMGRLDEGGPRGECMGLSSLLESMIENIASTFGPVLRLSEAIYDINEKKDSPRDVDLVTAGVWVPIVTALMADAGIQMAIFSPGIADILQRNYVTLDTFLCTLSKRLLQTDQTSDEESKTTAVTEMFFLYPKISADNLTAAQDRIYAHPKTTEYAKRWNLPIYYQLRFGECCNRLNKAIDATQRQGWEDTGDQNVFSGSGELAESYKSATGFQLPLFLELYDLLIGLWRPDVILRPLSHRFMRGSVQLVGRMVDFIEKGMKREMTFGGNSDSEGEGGNKASEAPIRDPYYWAENEKEVAAVARELSTLERILNKDYVAAIVGSISCDENQTKELSQLTSEVIAEASQSIRPLIDMAWNTIIVDILTKKCSGPLAAVKGVAATYRMTNRPPPTQASPFIAMILRPLLEFEGNDGAWKADVVSAVAEHYRVAVADLLATVQRTETALQNRRARRTTGGGMSDGDKVKLQVYLDFTAFSQHVTNAGVDAASIEGMRQLKVLVAEGEALRKQTQKG